MNRGNIKLVKMHGKRRASHAVRVMQNNPSFRFMQEGIYHHYFKMVKMKRILFFSNFNRDGYVYKHVLYTLSENEKNIFEKIVFYFQ